ncbi:sulfotransferase [Streptomyces sp. NPDC047079]|uniref:sulfotransferase family protein n=1 Tax=Streptomyces sp. NPDC047079 TaxID=3154607 RepID=UPI00340C013E
MTGRHALSCKTNDEVEIAPSLRRPNFPFALDEVLTTVQQQRGEACSLPPCFLPAYARLTASLADEADLTPTGLAIARRRLVTALANQLTVRELIERQDIESHLHGHDAVFVLGLPGTGLYRLQRLLSQHSALNIPSLWEILSPGMEWRPWRSSPPNDPFEYALWARLGQRSGFRPPDLGAPYGDHLLLTYAFHTPSASLEYRIPGYADWLEAQDATTAYEFHRYALTVILERVSGGVPVLVNEFHSLKLPELLRIYPTARVIRVHRDPLASLSNVVGTSILRRRAWSHRVDPREVTAEWAGRLLSTLFLPEWHEALPIGAEVLDVTYPELVDTPLLTLRRICEFLGTPLPTSVERRALEQCRQFSRFPEEGLDRGHPHLLNEGLPGLFNEYRGRYCRRWGVQEL